MFEASFAVFRKTFQRLRSHRSLYRAINRLQFWLGVIFLDSLIAASSALGQDPATVGQWSAVMTWPYTAVHAHLLPTGKVLWWTAFSQGDNPELWDPTTNVVTAGPKAGANIFCSGHAFLPNGRLLVGGGHVSNYVGIPNAYIYNPFSNNWTRLPDMNDSRWYPTGTTLPNGDALMISGWIDTTQGVNVEPQVWQTATGSWRNLSAAHLALPFYPFMHVAPNGKVFCAGPGTVTRYLDVTGAGAWSLVANSNFGTRNWGSSVMYDDGKVLLIGGTSAAPYSFTPGGSGAGGLPTATAEIIDLNSSTPTWKYTGSLAGPRKLHNATLLADGKVLVTGGIRSRQDPNMNPSDPAFTSEMWDPATGTWLTMASFTLCRSYHSIALLLPNGRVLSAGGTYGGKSAEIYSPPYLFKGARPSISSAPTGVGYGQSFFVGTADATSIIRVTMIALPSVTHGFNMGQRIIRPSFSLAGGGLNVVAPSSQNTAPPGYYMLFILNGNGVPSIAKIMQISGTAPTPTPTPRPTPTPTPTLTAPTNLTGVAASASTIKLSWTDNSINEAGFNIGRSTGGTTFTKIATVGANVTAYLDTGLARSARYSYRVSAFNSGGSSAHSNAATVALVVPAAPANLTAVVAKRGQVTLNWRDNADNETGFQVERSTNGTVFTVIATTAANTNTTKYRDTKAKGGQTHYYRVAAKNNVGLSSYSNTVTIP
jgi:galactose oxidase